MQRRRLFSCDRERWTSHTLTKIDQRSRGLPPSARPPPVRLHLALPLRSHTTVAPSRGRNRLTNSPSSWAIGRVRVAVNPRARERPRGETVRHNSRRLTDTSLRKSEYIICLPAPLQDSSLMENTGFLQIDLFCIVSRSQLLSL